MKQKAVLFAAILIIIAVGVFYGGMKYAGSKASQRFMQGDASQNRFSGGRAGNQSGAGFVSGSIISKDDKSITVQLRSGGSKIVFYSDATEIGKFVSGTANDLEISKTITVTGSANEDGSITAQSIQIRPKTANPSR